MPSDCCFELKNILFWTSNSDYLMHLPLHISALDFVCSVSSAHSPRCHFWPTTNQELQPGTKTIKLWWPYMAIDLCQVFVCCEKIQGVNSLYASNHSLLKFCLQYSWYYGKRSFIVMVLAECEKVRPWRREPLPEEDEEGRDGSDGSRN